MHHLPVARPARQLFHRIRNHCDFCPDQLDHLWPPGGRCTRARCHTSGNSARWLGQE
jgi:hypothetical protein